MKACAKLASLEKDWTEFHRIGLYFNRNHHLQRVFRHRPDLRGATQHPAGAERAACLLRLPFSQTQELMSSLVASLSSYIVYHIHMT